MPQIHPCNNQECATFDELIQEVSTIFSSDDPNIDKFPGIYKGDIHALDYKAIPYLMMQNTLRILCAFRAYNRYNLLPYATLYNEKRYMIYMTGNVVKHQSRQATIVVHDTGIVDHRLMIYKRIDINCPEVCGSLLDTECTFFQYGLYVTNARLQDLIENIVQHLDKPIK